MRPELLAWWNEIGSLSGKRRAEMAAAELEKYWNEAAPKDETFEPAKATVLLLHTLKRYEEALLRIAEKPGEQKKLMEHRESTGKEVTESDQQRWFAYLKTGHSAAEALGRPDLHRATKNAFDRLWRSRKRPSGS